MSVHDLPEPASAAAGQRPRPASARVGRLQRRGDFAITLRQGRRARHPLLHLAVRRTDRAETRIGLSVSKRLGGAVTRNRVKRRLRMIIRTVHWQPSLDVVVIAQPGAERATFDDLSSAFARTAERANASRRDSREQA